ncbi:MAG: DNA methyltransferase, partial [Anaerolineae bacterium]
MLSLKERELAPTAALNQGLPCLDWYLMPESFSAPLIRSAIDEYKLKPGQTVLDPFSGTGTTVLTAMLHGLNGIGIEVNPFLCFAARIKTHFA